MTAERSRLVTPKSPIDEGSIHNVENCIDPIVKESKEELDCENNFAKNFVQNFYKVRLPIKHSCGALGVVGMETVSSARKAAFIKEYFNLGHMSLHICSASYELEHLFCLITVC